MIELTCPRCQARIEAPDAAVGNRVTCAKCGALIDVFVPPSPDSPETSGSDDSFDAEAVEAQRKARRRLMMMVMATAGLVTLVVAVILVVVLAVNPPGDGKPGEAAKGTPKATSKEDARRQEEIRRQAEKEAEEKLTTALFGTVATGVLLLIFLAVLAYFVLVVAVMVWVARDADNRGHEGAVWGIIYAVPQLLWFTFPVLLFIPIIGWMLIPVSAVLSWLGFVVYLCARRRGNLTDCGSCRNKRLEYVKTCPHCGHT
jgi:hypothetical protein